MKIKEHFKFWIVINKLLQLYQYLYENFQVKIEEEGDRGRPGETRGDRGRPEETGEDRWETLTMLIPQLFSNL